jgi:hypothetical protein
MLTWVRSPNSLHNFETLKDYNVSRQKQETLLRSRLTQASDFFPGERGRKKIKKFSEDPKKYFSKVRGFLSGVSFKKYNNKIQTLNYFIIFLCSHSLD